MAHEYGHHVLFTAKAQGYVPEFGWIGYDDLVEISTNPVMFSDSDDELFAESFAHFVMVAADEAYPVATMLVMSVLRYIS
jgi:hypothetical protein